MKKDYEKLISELSGVRTELSDLKKIIAAQNKQIEDLKRQLVAATTVKIEEDGKQSEEKFGNLILDEIISVKKKLEGFSAEGIRNVVNDVATLKNRLEDKADSEFSLQELKAELLKLADMMSV